MFIQKLMVFFAFFFVGLVIEELCKIIKLAIRMSKIAEKGRVSDYPVVKNIEVSQITCLKKMGSFAIAGIFVSMMASFF